MGSRTDNPILCRPPCERHDDLDRRVQVNERLAGDAQRTASSTAIRVEALDRRVQGLEAGIVDARNNYRDLAIKVESGQQIVVGRREGAGLLPTVAVILLTVISVGVAIYNAIVK